jgi:hypothetical protein
MLLVAFHATVFNRLCRFLDGSRPDIRFPSISERTVAHTNFVPQRESTCRETG